MKLLIALSVLISSQTLFACSLGYPASVQTMNLERILEAPSYKRELGLAQQADMWVHIEGISFGQTVDVALSNGCKISSWLVFAENTPNGMCPQIIGVKSETSCPQ